MPMAVWKEYCQSLPVGRFDENNEYPYTVGPPAKVVAFFHECIFKKTYTKHIPIGADMRTQVALQGDEMLDYPPD